MDKDQAAPAAETVDATAAAAADLSIADKPAAEATEQKDQKEKKEKKEKPKKEKVPKEKKPNQQGGGGGGGGGGKKEVKKETLLGLSVKKSEDYGKWYSEVVVQSELIEYYDVSGCYILRPWSYSIWETIKDFFDAEIKQLGVQNSYFPMFVSERALNAEKDHVEGFAPEVAWVTKSGQSELDVPIAIRPTSETVMYPIYAKWIHSHRDLPLKLNQWNSVVRWEFKHPTPFIRSREFLWQEGHTAFASKEEADVEVLAILELYRRIYEELLAVPVVKGVKSEREKFAGGLYTTTVEAFIPATGRGIQSATSHCLGQNFAKMFNIEFEDDKGAKQMVWQNSWGLSTRSIGVMVMVHSDDKGLVLPPNVAPIQAIVVPIPFKDADRAAVVAAAADVGAQLRAAGVRVKEDARDNYSPGFKYNFWELRGVPIRVELGPRDLANKQVVLVRRDTGAKESAPWEGLGERVKALLATIHADMLARATKERDDSIVKITKWEEFMPAIDAKKMVLAPWCDEEAVEEDVRKRSAGAGEGGSAKTLCMPFEQPELPEGALCFASGKPAKKWALWGRSY
ncbi:unnamed protein product [Closterium sp. NIES-64]|nr:unnamed protein product [Closterium sp. NIES-64]CAI6003872.1 unnamed protein product [Closterium sp. NIES-65]CAI6008284.1 unnamed protein product [Closterium sp. NIES-65]